MQIILDISNNTLKSDITYFRRMLKELSEVIPDNCGHEIILKTQLFIKEGDNIPTSPRFFYYMVNVAYREYGLKLTASVFDRPSVDTLLLFDYGYELPFVKIANRPGLRPLSRYIPRGIPIYQSASPEEFWGGDHVSWWGHYTIVMVCVSEYPATVESYKKYCPPQWKPRAISDHTVGLDLVKESKPKIWEKHFKLDDSTGPDAGPFAITPIDLKELLVHADW